MKTAEEIYMEVQEKYPASFGAYVLPEDWEIEAMHAYAAQFQQEWVMPDSTDKAQSENLDSICLYLPYGRMIMYYDWIDLNDAPLPEWAFLLPSPPKEK